MPTELEQILESTPTGRLDEERLLKKLQLEKREPVKHIFGYFEMSALVGAATIMTPVMLGLGFLGYAGGRNLILKLRG